MRTWEEAEADNGSPGYPDAGDVVQDVWVSEQVLRARGRVHPHRTKKGVFVSELYSNILLQSAKEVNILTLFQSTRLLKRKSFPYDNIGYFH